MPKRDRSDESDNYSHHRRRHHSPERPLDENLHEPGTIIDRDWRRHVWRHSKNISERTKNLEVPFRVIIAPYGTLQRSEYLGVMSNHTPI